jgi:hypothetical protein
VITELKSILVPRLFWSIVFKHNTLGTSGLLKAIEVHDFLTSPESSPFNIPILNQVPDRGAAQMAYDLYKYYYMRDDKPLWFANATEKLEGTPEPIR